VAGVPRRWLLLGAGGAGKSTLARGLRDALGLPVIHLDRHYWRPGWVEPTPAEWERQVGELAEGDAWIMDGNYSGTLHVRLPRAQVAILLDPPMIQCLWGVTRRSMFGAKTRPDLPDGCEDPRVPDLQFLRYIAAYRTRSRPRVLRMLGDAPHVRVHHFRSRGEAKTFLESVSRIADGLAPG
jgi:adenylate kinase family enzyme